MNRTELTRKISWPAWAQQPDRLREPCVGIAPDGGTVLRDGQVKVGIGEGRMFGAGVDEREPQPEAVLELACGGPVAPRSCPARRAACRGGPAGPTRTRCCSLARCCGGPPGQGAAPRPAPRRWPRCGRLPAAQACPGVAGSPLVPCRAATQDVIRGLGHSGQLGPGTGGRQP
jgi:hypothetical protein